jgi:uncharacterized protein (UPF0276 family)
MPFTGHMVADACVALPVRSGIGLKPEHFHEILDTRPDLGFFEIHAENYMVDGGPFHHYLGRIREHYALSIHGVGLSIGGESTLDETHLDRLAALLDRYQPESFSEHLAWSSHGGRFFNDLLPLPYHQGTLTRVCEHIHRTQERLKRSMLLENPATYLEFSASTMSETDFIAEIIRRTGCGLLLDVNNVYVSCINHHRDAHAYLRAIPATAVGEIHLAGFTRNVDTHADPHDDGAALLIDSHGTPIDQAVWNLYEFTLDLLGPIPTLIERDNDIPTLSALLGEAQQAERLMQIRHAKLHTAS